MDWNHDGDFTDASPNETIAVDGSDPNIFTATITPPGGALSGDARMRIRIMYTGQLNPCGPTTYGEVEDYTITVDQPVMPIISGYVLTSEDDPVEGVLITGTNGIASTTTDENGYYELTTPTNPWSGDITPSKTFWSFDSATYELVNIIQDTTSVDFEGTNTYNYGGGQGTIAQPYLIYTPEQMNQIGLYQEHWDSHFILMDDINMSAYTGTSFNIAGTNASNPFQGSFDGNNHTISNFTYESDGEFSNGTYGAGLFGCVGSSSAVIKDVTMVNAQLTVNSAPLTTTVGILVGRLNGGVIENCQIVGGSLSGSYGKGGLVGYVGSTATVQGCNVACDVTSNREVGGVVSNNAGQVIDCHFDGNVSGYVYIGGVVGCNQGNISYCSSSGTVTILPTSGSRYEAGGLVGENRQSIRYSHSSSSVTGAEAMGGLVGENYFADIIECYATGDVSGSIRLGGLVGRNHMGGIVNCYSRGDVTGSGNAAGIGGLVGVNHHSYGTNRQVENSYATGVVSGSVNTGGLIGYDYDGAGNFENCFWNSTVNPTFPGIGNVSNPEVIGETSSNMTFESTFADAGWDFVDEGDNGFEDFWRMCIDGQDYPELSWKFTKGDFTCPDGVGLEDFAVFARQWLLTEPSIDFAPTGGGDGIVNALDWAVFAEAWQSTSEPPSANWDPKCDIAPAGGDGVVDMNDLRVFMSQWLQLSAFCADIAPPPDGDGVVNALDFAAFAENWLEGVE